MGLMWKSVTRIGCYSGARGGFKVVSCRYAASAYYGGSGCDIPNMPGCDQLQVPALLYGRCEPMPGSVMPHIALPVSGRPGSPVPQLALPLPILQAGISALVDGVRSALQSLHD